MFQPKFNAAKLKVSLKLAINRVKMLQKKKENQRTINRKEIAQQIEKDKIELAAIRTEQAIRDDNMIETLELMELYFNTLVSRMGTIEQMKSCDPSIRDAVCTVIWVTPHLQAEVPEMKQITQYLTTRYGKEFAKDALENNSNCVSDRVIKKMSCAQPGEQLVQASMMVIASSYNVSYTPPPAPVPEEFLGGHFDPMMFPNAPSGDGSFGGDSHILPGAANPYGGQPPSGPYNGWGGPGGPGGSVHPGGGVGPGSFGGPGNDLNDVFPPAPGGGREHNGGGKRGGGGGSNFGGGAFGGGNGGPADHTGGNVGYGGEQGFGVGGGSFGGSSVSGVSNGSLYPPTRPAAGMPENGSSELYPPPDLYPPTEPRPHSPGGSSHLDGAALKAMEAREHHGGLPEYSQAVNEDSGVADVDRFDPFPMPPTSSGGAIGDDMPAIPGQQSVGGQSVPGAGSGADFDDLMKRFHDMKAGDR